MVGEQGGAAWRLQGEAAHIYRKGIVARLAAAVGLPLIILVLLAVAATVLVTSEAPLPASKIAGAVALVVIALLLVRVLVVELSYRVTLTDAAITVERWGDRRELRRDAIKGRRVAPRGRGRRKITLVPRDPSDRPLVLAQDLSVDATFEAWLAQLRDLDAEDLARSEAEILADARYGATAAERAVRLARARARTKWLGGVALAVAAWCLLLPWPYLAAVGAAAVAPVLLAVLVATSGGLVRFAKARTEAYAGPAGAAILFCVVALGVQAFHVELLDMGAAFKAGSVAGAAMLAVAVLIDRSLLQRLVTFGIAAVVALGYGIAATVLADVLLDRAGIEVFHTRVLSSQMSRGKSTSYRLQLAPWGPQQMARGVSVPRQVFDALPLGSDACVALHPGALGFRWYAVVPCTATGATLQSIVPRSANSIDVPARRCDPQFDQITGVHSASCRVAR